MKQHNIESTHFNSKAETNMGMVSVFSNMIDKEDDETHMGAVAILFDHNDNMLVTE